MTKVIEMAFELPRTSTYGLSARSGLSRLGHRLDSIENVYVVANHERKFILITLNSSADDDMQKKIKSEVNRVTAGIQGSTDEAVQVAKDIHENFRGSTSKRALMFFDRATFV